MPSIMVLLLLFSVCCCSKEFSLIAVGSTSRPLVNLNVATSATGISWKGSSPFGTLGDAVSVACNPSVTQCVVVGRGDSSTIMTTFDGGLTFIPGTNVFGDSGRGVAVDVVRKIWIAVGWGHPWAAISNNGIHFNAVNSSNLATGDAITYSRSRQLWLAVGSDNNANSLVATSPNGLDWTTRSVIGKSYTAACNIELCLIGGTNNYGNHSSSIMYSTDAFTWNPANTQNALITIVFGVAYSSSQRLWVVVGNFDDFSPTIATSTDGKTFNGIASTKGLFSSAYSVAFSQSLGLWVAGGVGSTVNNTALAWSKDGNSWTAVQTDGIIEEVLGVASMVDELAE